ncbi:glycosyltransferase family 2 protein [Roseinatronobacter alkalisoli]|uniref:Glycosyltransferase n=1 Tax=Roseinatronobacter alkalisoli TaxID=3028235 RepID=A0ABT5T5L6_9RHOB|nr:glycosyltransferase family 2 protein [Roseinatronobacter sp. HJB301]MDD7970410.1 glycosyltransferase [Roseinatronobacter sp. HJB301]
MRHFRHLAKQSVHAALPLLRLSVLRNDRTASDRLGAILCDMGAITADGLVDALHAQTHHSAGLGDILIAQGQITEATLMQALSVQFGTPVIDHMTQNPDPALTDLLGAARCLALRCMPWRHAGAVTVVATTRPDQFDSHRPELEAVFGPVVPALISENAFHDTLLRLRRSRLKLWAESCVSDTESCRSMQFGGLRVGTGLFLAALICLGVLAPQVMLIGLMLIASVFLALSATLKLAAAIASFRHTRHPESSGDIADIGLQRKPVVTILVPLYKEPETVPRLLIRLSRLTWPRNLLDILLIVEEGDHATRQALDKAAIPRWMRVVPVPDARLKTKPRALNYAMLFARGTLIGVYDAEDAPEPDQIHRVVACFQNGPANLACVQGVLDFYNPRSNWLARCFTIEYASWFRVILPGMQRLGLAVPLGGTTLFFRRDILERLGGWDAHNVTEDADLGIRLARRGYYTQLLDTVTYEEANCRAIPWVKQRSRWLKGYAVTWLVHMRDPRALWQQLGAWRFFGVQVLFLGTLVQFMLAPLLWSFWLVLAGVGHPFMTAFPDGVLGAFIGLFLMSEAVNLSIGILATNTRHHRHLRLWLPTLHGYFPLAVLAVYKALWELISAPFYWDKTSHGQHGSVLDAVAVHGQS